MRALQKYYKQSATYKIFSGIFTLLEDFLSTLGEITIRGLQLLKGLLTAPVDKKELVEQCDRFLLNHIN